MCPDFGASICGVKFMLFFDDSGSSNFGGSGSGYCNIGWCPHLMSTAPSKEFLPESALCHTIDIVSRLTSIAFNQPTADDTDVWVENLLNYDPLKICQKEEGGSATMFLKNVCNFFLAEGHGCQFKMLFSRICTFIIVPKTWYFSYFMF